jgi:hypothetical protein
VRRGNALSVERASDRPPVPVAAPVVGQTFEEFRLQGHEATEPHAWRTLCVEGIVGTLSDDSPFRLHCGLLLPGSRTEQADT